ncbi:hypothetical protein M0R45_027527 [Rubus argutus]|uniref:Uncharacterized protein n=1 Tax=Rubus argutus TaxID=59490 RepID=A0AAW1X2C2_RUBAR
MDSKALKKPHAVCVPFPTQAQELGLPEVIFETTSASASMCFLQFAHVIEKGLVPLKDASYLTNGYLDTVLLSPKN